MSEQVVHGLAALDKALSELPLKMERNWMRGAMRAGAKVQLAQAQRDVPVGPPSGAGAKKYGGYAGALRDSLRISTSVKNGVVKAKVSAGGKGKGGADTFYARMVEFGTKPHEIRPKGHRSLFFAGLMRKLIQHPGAKPRRYLRPALYDTATLAVAATGEYLRARFRKADINVPGPENF